MDLQIVKFLSEVNNFSKLSANDFLIESRKALKKTIFATQELGVPC